MKLLPNFFQKVLTLSALFFFAATLSFAYTNIAGGTISTDSTWTLAGSPYHVNGDLTISSSGSLHIQAGVVVKFNGSSVDINVNGMLDVQGSSNNRVVFTSIHDDTYGGDSNGNGQATLPGRGNWGYIGLNNSDGSKLEHCLIRYGGYSIYYDVNPYSLLINGCNPTVQNCTVEASANDGIRGINLPNGFDMENDSVRNCSGWGINYSTGALYNEMIIKGHTITSCSGGGIYSSLNYGKSTIMNNKINACDNSGIKLYRGKSNSVISNNILFQNSYNSIETEDVIGVLISNNTITINSTANAFRQTNTSFPTYSANTIIGGVNKVMTNGVIDGTRLYPNVFDFTWGQIQSQDFAYVIDGNISINANSKLTIQPGRIIKFKDFDNYPGNDLNVYGTLESVGTVSNRIIFTSYHDDTFGGDINGNGQATLPGRGNWGYIGLNNSDSSKLEHCLIRYGGYSVYYDVNPYSLLINGCNPTVQNCTVEASANDGIRGINLPDGLLLLTNNTIRNNSGNGVNLSKNSGIGYMDLRNNIYQTNNIGLYLSNATAFVDKSGFSGNSVGCLISGANTSQITNSYFMYNSDVGIKVVGNSNSNPQPVMNMNNFINNTNFNIRLESYQSPATTIVNAQNNWYNTTDTTAIKAKLYHQPNNSSSATLNWKPILTAENDKQDSIYCLADINLDAIVNGQDLALLGFSFGKDSTSIQYNRAADINRSGRVDGFDLAILGINFGNVGGCLPADGFLKDGEIPLIKIISDLENKNIGDTVTVDFQLSRFDQPFAFVSELRLDSNLLGYVSSSEGGLFSAEYQLPATQMIFGNENIKITGVTRIDGTNPLPFSEGNMLQIKFIMKRHITNLASAIIIENPMLMNANGEWEYNPEIKYENAIGIPEPESFANTQWSASPNPFYDQISIRYQISQEYHVKIKLINTLGAVIQEFDEGLKSVGIHSLVVNTGVLPNGIYFLILETSDGLFSRKMIHLN